jgi:MscS family membrane protein
MRRCFQLLAIVFSFAALTTPAAAQDAVEPTTTNTRPSVAVDRRFASPRDTMLTFLVNMDQIRNGNDAAWPDVLACFDLTSLAPDFAREAAYELWGALNKLEYIDDDTPLPDRADVRAMELQRFTYFPDPRFTDRLRNVRPEGSITFTRDSDGAWRFTVDTVRGAGRLFASLESLDTIDTLADVTQLSLPLWLRSQMPRSLRGADHELLSIEYWQWIGLFLIVLLGVIIDFLTRSILRGISNRLIARQKAQAQPETVAQAVRPIGLLAGAIVWLLLVRVLGLPDMAQTVILGAARVFAAFAGTWAAWRVTDLFSEVLVAKASHTETKFDDVLVPLVRKAAKIFIVAIGLIYIADSLRIEIIPLIASLGIGGLAFAFAARDTVENFFGSVAVLLDRPFEVGDWVVVGDTEGIVEEVGFRSTRIRTFYNSQITLPNANLVRATVDNYGRRKYRRWKTNIGVEYSTPPDKLVAFTEGIRELIRCHPMTRKDYYQVYLNAFGPSSLDILLYVFHEVPDWSTELRERERLFLDIVRLADRLGVNFAFPTQTVHLFKEDASKPHEARDVPGSLSDRRAMVTGIRAVHDLVDSQPWKEQPLGPVTFSQGPTQISDDENFIEDRTSGG